MSLLAFRGLVRADRMARVMVAATVLGTVACGGSESPRSAAEPLRSAARWLWSQQQADGSWRSDRYSIFRGGQALTPFLLFGLLQVPESVVELPRDGVNRALDFLRRHLDEQGALGYADPAILEYPVYATAYAMRCLHLAGTEEDRPLIRRMARWLRDMQCAEGRGFSSEHPAYGAWSFGERHLAQGESGHVDLSHTRRVLEALEAVGECSSDHRQRAFRFLALTQKQLPEQARQPFSLDQEDSIADGGFYYSPIVFDANKGGFESRGKDCWFASYSTPTCDGILALLAAGDPDDSPRIRDARQWLNSRPRWDLPDGIPAESPLPWDRALRFYHYAVRAETYAALDMDGPWRQEGLQALLPWQQPDGRFENTESSLQKEDEPLLATIHAVIALTRFQATSVLSDETGPQSPSRSGNAIASSRNL